MASIGLPAMRDVRFEPDEQPPRLLSAGLGLQYVLLSIAGIVLIPAIIVRTADASESYLTWAVFAALCTRGVSTVMQSLRLGRIGAGYILMMGTSGAFIAASVDALRLGGPDLLATLIIFSSLIQFALAAKLSLLHRLITPEVTGTMIMLLAVTIMPIIFKMFQNVPAGASPTAAPASAGVTLVLTVGLALFGTGYPAAVGRRARDLAGCSIAAYHGIYDSARVAQAPWIGWPSQGWPGIDLGFGLEFWSLLPVFIIVTIIGAIKIVGDAIGIQQVSWRMPHATDFRSVQGAVSAYGLGNLLSGLLGTVPNTTYSDKIAHTELTGVAARSVGIWAGALLAAFAFLPKATAAILAIPDPVQAAYMIVLLSMLFVLGMRIAVQEGVDHRKTVVIGLAYWLGVACQNGELFPDLADGQVGTMLESGIVAGGFAALVMTVLINLGGPKRRRMETKLESESITTVHDFLRKFAGDKHWGDASIARLCAAGEEAVLCLGSDADGTDDNNQRHLLVVARGDRRTMEIEFVTSSTGENLEDQLALLGTWVEESLDRDVSLRLLRHYASSVKHHQYHDTDILAVRVDSDPKSKKS